MGRGTDSFTEKGMRDGPSECRLCRPHSCCTDGYIVERVICRHSEDVCFEGQFSIQGLPPHLCPPLMLRSIEVCCISPCGQACCGGACGCADERLRVDLQCIVEDGRGCRAQGTAAIEICVRAGQIRIACGDTVRRGARAELLHACMCASYVFHAAIRFCVTTVVSRCEMIAPHAACPSSCLNLPLYPSPAGLPRRGHCEHFLDS